MADDAEVGNCVARPGGAAARAPCGGFDEFCCADDDDDDDDVDDASAAEATLVELREGSALSVSCRGGAARES